VYKRQVLEFFKRKAVPAKVIGKVGGKRGIIKHKGREVVNIPIEELKELYENSLERELGIC
jgi:phosphoribosylformylglycinamidine (FGAM) synthase-like enzyme